MSVKVVPVLRSNGTETKCKSKNGDLSKKRRSEKNDRVTPNDVLRFYPCLTSLDACSARDILRIFEGL